MYLYVVHIRKRLKKDISIVFVVGNIVTKSHHKCFVVPFYLPVCLVAMTGTVSCFLQLFVHSMGKILLENLLTLSFKRNVGILVWDR